LIEDKLVFLAHKWNDGTMEYWNNGAFSHRIVKKLDQLHYKVENALLKLIESLQKKQKDQNREDSFQTKK
jgi:hypothetical protein